MARALSIDTSFLIDLERERARGEQGAAHGFLRREGQVELCLSVVALGELIDGYGDPSHPALWAIRRSHRLLAVDDAVAAAYGVMTRALRVSGSLIGSNDLWIAATALHHGLPLVTADLEHFGRVHGLEVIGYR